MPWSARFDDPISLPDGRKLPTLRDAAEYITAEWQAAMEALLLVVQHNGPTIFARIAMMRALNRRAAKAAPAPRRKRAKAYPVVR